MLGGVNMHNIKKQNNYRNCGWGAYFSTRGCLPPPGGCKNINARKVLSLGRPLSLGRACTDYRLNSDKTYD